MGCTCFSSDTSVKCDHQRDGDENWTVEIVDDDPATITINDDELKAWAAEAKAIRCPRKETCMRGVGRPVKQCSAKSGECPLRDGSRATGKGFDFDDDRMAAAMAAGQAKSEYYNTMHRRFAEQDRLWAQIELLHKMVKKPRPVGMRTTVDFGASVPPHLRYLTY